MDPLSSDGRPMRTDLRWEELPGDDVISAVGGVARVRDGGVARTPEWFERPLLRTGIRGDTGVSPAAGLLGDAIEDPGPLTTLPLAAPELIECVDERRKKGIEDGVSLRVVDGRREGLPFAGPSLAVRLLVVFV